MKVATKRGFLLAAVMAATLALALPTAGGSAVYAAEGGQTAASIQDLAGVPLTDAQGGSVALSGESASDFVYMADIDADGGQAGGLVFGAQDEETYFAAYADFEGGALYVSSLTADGEKKLASSDYDFDGTRCTVYLEVRDGEVLLDVGNDGTVELVYSADDYAGGRLGLYSRNATTTATNLSLKLLTVSATYEGGGDVVFDIGGYDVEKVVNVTDSSARLADTDYKIEGGKLTINGTYLSRLDASGTYEIRAVCEQRDLDFTVTNSFEGATAAADKREFSPFEDVLITVTGANKVEGVTVDGVAVDADMYTYEDGKVAISYELGLIDGKHSTVILTDAGRPAVDISVAMPRGGEEEVEKNNFTFFIIDMTIFVVFIGACIFAPVIGKKFKKAE